MRALTGLTQGTSSPVKEENSSRSKDRHGRMMVKHQAPSKNASAIRDKIEKMKHKKEMKAKAELEAKQAKIDAEAEAKAKAAESKESQEIKEVKRVNLKGEPIIGDIKSNDPNAPEVRGKLKDLLSSGGFHFNDKERAALSAILKDD